MAGGRQRSNEALRTHAGNPREAALTHQAHRYLANTGPEGLGLLPLCSRCVLREHCSEYDDTKGAICRPAAEGQEHLLQQTLDLPHIDKVQDFGSVVEFVKMTIVLSIIDRYVTETGLFQKTKEGLDLVPILQKRITYASHLARLSDRLGLNPMARQKLGAAGKPMHPVHVAWLEMKATEEAAQEADNGREDADEVE